jgi:single-strand DNA-binding protein
MINVFTGVGRLTANAELKFLGSGTPVCNFSICINKSYKKDGDWKDKPNFFNCVIWGKYGEAMHRHLTKGRMIGITGELAQDTWEDSEGRKHQKISIVCNSVSLMAKPGDKSGGGKDAPSRESDYSSGDNPPF